ncbi:Trans-enoyl reductase fsl5 [Meristemomyces frigidus]|nr:Trans-enoyl reductase fsl5 [Meristemomyces frigidus]
MGAASVHGTTKGMQAIVGNDNGWLELIDDARVPELEPDMVLVKNAAVALNPVDIKMLGKLATKGAVAGHDFAGTVLDIGSSVWTAAPIKVGDRVCGAVQGMHSLTPTVGAFGQYVGATDVVLVKVPTHMSFEEAASLGTGIGTMGLALFRSLQVPGYPTKPASEEKTVLVYGGSTASGTIALQLLRLSGLRAITTCSPANFDLVRSYGAAECFDYRSKDCIKQIKAYTKNSLKYVVDCVSEPETMELCYACIGRSGCRMTTLEPPPSFLHTRAKTVFLDWVLGPALHGKPIDWPEPMKRDAAPELREFANKWFITVQQLLDDGKLRPHPLKQMTGGLPAVFEGTELLRKKAVSGQKLVYSLL